jgi:hypothetical protein
MLRSTSADSNDALASLLATATVALDTDRRAAKRCIHRAAVLLGIDLSSGGDVASQPSFSSARAISFEPFARPLESLLLPTS